MSCVISRIKFTLGLKQSLISTGFFVVKNVGKLFLNMIIIPMAELESQNKLILLEKNF